MEAEDGEILEDGELEEADETGSKKQDNITNPNHHRLTFCNDDGDLWNLHLTFDLYNPHLHVPSHLNTSEENGGEN
jgi:hypothetical protein